MPQNSLTDRIANLKTNTRLTPEELYHFRKWGQRQGLENWNGNPFKGTDMSPYSDYDMPGYWKAGATGAGMDMASAEVHYPDTYKKPGHETFSIESKYATPQRFGGVWSGDTYVPEQTQNTFLEYVRSLMRNYKK